MKTFSDPIFWTILLFHKISNPPSYKSENWNILITYSLKFLFWPITTALPTLPSCWKEEMTKTPEQSKSKLPGNYEPDLFWTLQFAKFMTQISHRCLQTNLSNLTFANPTASYWFTPLYPQNTRGAKSGQKSKNRWFSPWLTEFTPQFRYFSLQK